MASTGTATLDFGAFPGAFDATVVVTGQAGIVGGSAVEAWVVPAVTTDHSEDEHAVEQVYVYVAPSSIVAGTGFTVRGVARGLYRCYGKFNIGWVWV